MSNKLIGIISNEGALKGIIEDDNFNVKVQITESGPRGLPGSDGYTPIKGIDYFDGEKGDKGNQGEVGPKGDKGDTGEQGPRGLQGEQGPKGNQGEIGPKGDKGEQGEQGIQGERGLQGEQGIPGLDGKPLEFHWNGTQLGIRIEGETTYQYVNLKGDKGDQGIQGEQGIRGEIGSQGPTGKSIEYNWNGTQLGVRVEGTTEYVYVDLKGEKGDAANLTAQHIINGLGYTPANATNEHTHDNKSTIDKFSEVEGKPFYNGEEIGGVVPNLTLNELTLGGRFKIVYNDIEDSLDIEVI